jgi:hypothetical protein
MSFAVLVEDISQTAAGGAEMLLLVPSATSSSCYNPGLSDM